MCPNSADQTSSLWGGVNENQTRISSGKYSICCHYPLKQDLSLIIQPFTSLFSNNLTFAFSVLSAYPISMHDNKLRVNVKLIKYNLK